MWQDNINPILMRVDSSEQTLAQKVIYQLLEELGGKATLGKIKALAKERYPDATQWHYAVSDLQKLAKWGYVAKVDSDTWQIREKLQY